MKKNIFISIFLFLLYKYIIIKNNIDNNSNNNNNNIYTSNKEELVRNIFNNIFCVNFKKVRPNFLKNPITSKNLELDGYSELILTPIGFGLAFEYNGKQHYEYSHNFHKDYNDFLYQKKKDKIKKELLEKNKIILITIPYNIKNNNLKEFILIELKKNKLNYFL